jgi:hypothetical protein
LKETVATVSPDVPRSAVRCGFRFDPIGTHLSRTIMVADLRVLMRACPPSATAGDYRDAVIEGNMLSKPTVRSRRITSDRLRELYALDPGVVLFRALRDLWDADEAAQPLLALLCATAPDPILRRMTNFLLSLPVGVSIGFKIPKIIALKFPTLL